MLEDVYGHSPIQKMFDNADVYGVGSDEARAAKKPVKLAIIGCGGVGQSKHIPAILRLQTIWEPIQLVGICMRNEKQGRKVEAMVRTRWFSDYQTMLDETKPDGVLVLSPDDVHYEHTMACLNRGISVLVEKPITRDIRQAQEMCETADRLGLTLMTVSNKRYSPPYLRAKKLMPANPAAFLGKFNLGYAYVDILEGGTIHLFDLVRYFMGDVQAVSAVATHHYQFNQRNYPFDNACINLEFASGAVGNVFTSSTALSLKPWERVEIYGEKSWLAVEDQHTLIVNDSEEGPSKTWNPVFPNTLIFDEEFGGFMGLIENFAECIRKMGKPLVTGWDGLEAYQLVEATHRSIREGVRVLIPKI